jgi:hypothetical protein
MRLQMRWMNCHGAAVLAAMLVPGFGGCAESSSMPTPPMMGGLFSGSGGAGPSGSGASGSGGMGAAGATSVAGGGAAGRAGTTGNAGGGAIGGGGGGAAGATAGAGAGSGAAGSTAGAGGGAGMTLPPGDGPMLPAIMGECPKFMNGSTIMVAGHRSIVITAGEPGKGGPLLFYWHGTAQSASEAQRLLPADVRNDIVQSGGIIAAFNGSQSGGGEGDCSGTAAHNQADFKAADQIAACAVRDHGIDPRRIYTTGCSAGGLQSGCMAMMRSSYIAAAAPNSGGIVGRPRWQDMGKPAVFSMHGGPSDMVIVTFSQTSMSLNSAVATQGGFVVNCNHGGGHCRAPAPLYSAAWRFMKDHPWGTTMSPWAGGVPSGTPDYCTVFQR